MAGAFDVSRGVAPAPGARPVEFLSDDPDLDRPVDTGDYAQIVLIPDGTDAAGKLRYKEVRMTAAGLKKMADANRVAPGTVHRRVTPAMGYADAGEVAGSSLKSPTGPTKVSVSGPFGVLGVECEQALLSGGLLQLTVKAGSWQPAGGALLAVKVRGRVVGVQFHGDRPLPEGLNHNLRILEFRVIKAGA